MRILFCFGTRPEAIKLAPLILEMKRCPEFDVTVCVTGQHREMLDQVMEIFKITSDYDLNLMTEEHTLSDLTARVITSVTSVIDEVKPDVVIVQGDTTTTMGAALAGFYHNIPVAHVEAGLRTYNMRAPFPEEMNRRLVSVLAHWHFAPTARSRDALLKENVESENVYVVGNTVVDALLLMANRLKQYDASDFPELAPIDFSKKIVLVTGHRRESFGEGFRNICEALRTVATDHPELEVVYPVHLNPQVLRPVHEILSGLSNVHLLKPLDYITFMWLLDRCSMVLTDSGGIQEEAPSLGKPVLVMRDTTERPEIIEAGLGKLVGTDQTKITGEVDALLNGTSSLKMPSEMINPYGDGTSSTQIADILVRELGSGR